MKTHWSALALSVVFALATGIPASAQAAYPFQNPSLPMADRVDDLVSRLTLEEKAAQMQTEAPAIPRLGIRAYSWWHERLPGEASGPATVFPQPIGLAATWDLPLHAQVAATVSDEARAKYNAAAQEGGTRRLPSLMCLGPDVSIFGDPRWGRGQETYGEDPYLTAQFGVAYVKGLQGGDPQYVKAIAALTQFAGHATVSSYDLNDTYLPAFEACVREGHARCFLAAGSRRPSVPDMAGAWLQDTLREKWGFEGYVVSERAAIDDPGAVKAGCDLLWGSEAQVLPQAVTQGRLLEEDLDRAVTRLFAARFELGLFDPPSQVQYAQISPAVIDGQAHRQLARRAARESLVLLKNDRHALPLGNGVRNIVVLGPYADVSVEAGIRQRLGGRGHVVWAGVTDSRETLAAAKRADAVIFVGGIGGSADRSDLNLPRAQQDLLQALAATGKPVILVVFSGGALSLNWAQAHLAAIVEAWHFGEGGGNAVADVLFGAYNPSGKLPVTFYTGMDQLPPLRDAAMKNRTYRYFSGKPLYPFGYGLSYTRFAYSHFQIQKQMSPDQPITVTAQVKNVGTRAGDEVAELYLRPAPGDTPRRIAPGQPMPRLLLAGFTRVTLAPQAHAVVKFALKPDQLRLVNGQGERKLQPGVWQIYIGGGQPDLSLPDGLWANGVSNTLQVNEIPTGKGN